MTMTSNDETKPVTIVSGPLGAGKTTLLNHLLNAPGGREIAVIVNDMGEVNVDADLLARSAEGNDLDIVDLSNGCICCRLQDDLLTEAERLAETREFDCLVVESSGISEPIPVARTFIEGSADSAVDPTDHYRLDTTVSVVDSYGFWKEFDAGASLPAGSDDADGRPLADVLIEAVEFCDVLLLNKCDMVPDEPLDEIEATVRTLQPRAEIVRTEHAGIDSDLVLDTGRFDFEDATRSTGWKRALARGEEHDHSAADVHGVSSVVYRWERPFHPERFDDWLDSWSGDIIRAKGVFHLPDRDDVMGLNQAGPSVQAGPIGEWNADDDRETQLVVIGPGVDEAGIATELESCLLTDSEIDDQSSFTDPFPS
jgi:G3E family GTPase